VKRLLSLETMSQSLQAHKYRSMASFERDFYELLNNGRAVTAEDSQVRHVEY
jgi:Bromodomain